MGIKVNVPPKKDHYFWENIYNKQELERFLKDLQDPSRYFWVEDRKWANKYLEKLLSALLVMDINTCNLEIYPYKYVIEIWVKEPGEAGKNAPDYVVGYKEGEDPKKIQARIAKHVARFWREMLKGPIKTAEPVFKDCNKYL